MGRIEILLIAVGLSMDAFAVSICKGLSLKKVEAKHMLKAGGWFGTFQGLMPLIGFLAGSIFASFIDKFDHYIAFVLLAFIGYNMIKEAREEDEDESDDAMDIKTMFILAIATSIDALSVGVTFAFYRVNIILAVVLIGITTFCFSVAGVKIGELFGNKYKSKAEFAGGIILILIGTKLLLEGIGIIG